MMAQYVMVKIIAPCTRCAAASQRKRGLRRLPRLHVRSEVAKRISGLPAADMDPAMIAWKLGVLEEANARFRDPRDLRD